MLNTSHEFLENLLDSAPDGIILLDAHGVLERVNQQMERLFGYEKGEMVGLTVEALVPDRFVERHTRHRESFFTTPRSRGMGVGLDLFAKRKDGSEFPVEISISPVAANGERKALAIIRDRTLHVQIQELRRQQLEEQNHSLREASRLKTQFLANMSHELRTPLNSIIGFTCLLCEGKVGELNSTQTEFLTDVLGAARHLLRIINDVLDYAKVEAGQLPFHPEWFDVSALVGEVVATCRHQIAEKSHTLYIRVAPTLQHVFLDTTRVRQILYNLLSNAIKFTPPKGQIDIVATEHDEKLWGLEVKDNGIGIHEEDQKRLFSEFQQLDTSVSKLHQGTGLGLALTKRLVEAMGGKVQLFSQSNVGSMFTVILPRQLMTKAQDKP